MPTLILVRDPHYQSSSALVESRSSIEHRKGTDLIQVIVDFDPNNFSLMVSPFILYVVEDFIQAMKTVSLLRSFYK